MERFSLHFRDRQVQSILQKGPSKFVQLSLEPGQGLTNHRAPLGLTVIVLTGQIRFTVEEREQVLEALEMLTIDPAVEHAVVAVEKSIVLLVLTPAGEPVPKQEPAKIQPLEHENAYDNPRLIEQVAPELLPLVEDHIALCTVLKSAESNPTKETIQEVLSVVERELNSHFTLEEKVLFPQMAIHVGGMDVGPVARLLEEHRRIRQLHGEATQLMSAWERQDDEHVRSLITNKLLELSRTLLNHLGKEDSHLFPMASRLLTAEEKAAVAAGLLEYGHTPQR